MPQMKRKTVNLRKSQDDFIKRKVKEIQRLVPPGEEDKVTESVVIQGLIDFWMAHEARKKPPDQIPHKN